MPIQFLAGDLFANDIGAQVFAQGCNCQGSMGAGIAKAFRQRCPEMYKEYRERCRAKPRRFNLGDAWLWKEDGKPWVFNLGTQEGYWHARARYEAIETALEKMKKQAIEENIPSIAVPPIGPRYGGLSWKKVRAIIERVFNDWAWTLYAYEEFVPAKGDSTG
jgi:O-acetyl-ADP-ribose deacetylase (regulator of RNase III)